MITAIGGEALPEDRPDRFGRLSPETVESFSFIRLHKHISLLIYLNLTLSNPLWKNVPSK